MTAANWIFLAVVVLAFGFFSLNAQRLARYLRIAKPDDRTDNPAFRLGNVLKIGIAQSKILRDPIAGALHASVFWGFIVLTAGTAEVILEGIVPG